MGGVFENFASGGFLALLFTIGTVLIIVNINSTEIDKHTNNILKEAKEIYSLDYSKLNNIKKIEINNKHEYFIILEKGDNEFEVRLSTNNIPHTQSDLQILDKKYNGIKISKGEVN